MAYAGWKLGGLRCGVATLAALVLLGGLTGCAGNDSEVAQLEATLEARERSLAQAREEVRQLEAARRSAEQSAEVVESELQQTREELDTQRRELERQTQRARQQAEQQSRLEAEIQQERAAAERAAVERERQLQSRQARLSELEAELTAVQSRISQQEQSNDRLRDAVAAAEELLQLMDAEQEKYENLDASGQPVEPLAPDLIAELEERKQQLIREAESLSGN